MVNLAESFPEGYKPSAQQSKLLKNIDQAFTEGYKFVVCCAPTGSGKSFISKTLSNCASSPSKEYIDSVSTYNAYRRNHLGSYVYEDMSYKSFGCFALTITKALQDQYQELFSDCKVLKGKSNYMCSYDENFSAEYAPCVHLKSIRDNCWSKNICPHYRARNEALVSSFASLNYNMFFALPNHLKKREYIVCDEASELEDQLVKEFTCEIVFDYLKTAEITIPPLPGNEDYGRLGRWVNSLSINIEDRIEDLKDIINNTKGLESYIKTKKQELISLLKVHGKIKTLIDTWHDGEYIIDRESKSVKFIPYRVDNLATRIFNYADKIVLMSATIIDHKSFCKTLGITDYKYIEAESTFNPSNAPIYCCNKIKLNHYNLKTSLPNIAKQIKEILEIHKNDKGIIHTQTNMITNYLQNNIKSKRIIYREPGVNNENLLDLHRESTTPTVIASPSMLYGVDLKGDLAKFQIIIKAPFLPVTDKRVSKKIKTDSNWYINKMLSALVQGCGRGVRSKNDFCATYVLDYSIIDSVINNKSKLPKYFIDRFE